MTDHTLAHTEEVRQLLDAKAASWAAKYAPQGRLTGRLTQLSCVALHPTLPSADVCWISAAVRCPWPGIWPPPGCG